MPDHDFEVVVIGGGAAGIAATRRLCDASVRCVLVEARPRLGGRAWTVMGAGFPLDLGCGWLHSGDRNPWTTIAEQEGFTIDKTPPPWMRPPLESSFPRQEHSNYREALNEYYARLREAARRDGADAPASTLIDPNNRWAGLISAISTFVSGAELECVSMKDLERYADTGVNWRVVEGLGTTIARHGADLPVMLDCPVQRVDHGGKRVRVETSKGVVEADQVIIAVPASLIAAERVVFAPGLPAKVEAASKLPLGVNNKLFMLLDNAEEFDPGTRLFGHTDRVATAGYHVRPFGRPLIEAYFGGRNAAELEAKGDGAFFDFAASELTGLLGNDFRKRIKPIGVHRWGQDPFSLGAYSYAVPGFADRRQTLAAPVDDRLFFAGEATSRDDFSTAHGGFRTGAAAAEQILALRGKTQVTRNTARSSADKLPSA
jgi:monoamine oxidase